MITEKPLLTFDEFCEYLGIGKTKGHEMLAGHNRQNAGKLAGLTEVPDVQ